MGQKNCQERGGEGESGQESWGIFIEERVGIEELREGGGLIVGEGDCELRASGERGGEG